MTILGFERLTKGSNLRFRKLRVSQFNENTYCRSTSNTYTQYNARKKAAQSTEPGDKVKKIKATQKNSSSPRTTRDNGSRGERQGSGVDIIV